MLFFWASECAGLNQATSTFWDCAQSFPVGGQAAIPHLKEHIQTFHMRYSSMIWYKRLQSDRQIIRLAKSALVFGYRGSKRID